MTKRELLAQETLRGVRHRLAQGKPVTLADARYLVGMTALLAVERLAFEVTVLEVRAGMSGVQARIAPANGRGSTWAPLSRLRLTHSKEVSNA